MANELTVMDDENMRAIVEVKGENYDVDCIGNNVELVRDVDFSVIPGTKSPSLLKSGAEKIVMAYGLLQHYTVESSIEHIGSGSNDPTFFFYRVKCELVKIGVNGQEYVFTTGNGSANTMERQCGKSNAFDSANSRLKMAQKRALVSAALSISGLSSMFTQDMENETFMSGYEKIQDTFDPESLISTKQIKRLYSIAYEKGYKANEAKIMLSEAGFSNTKEIKNKDYEKACAVFGA